MKTTFCILNLFLLMASGLLFSCNNSKSGDNANPADTVTYSAEIKKLNEQIAADPENAELFYERAKAFRNENYSARALQDIEKAIALDSTNALYHYSAGEIAFAGGKSLRAVTAFERSIALKPNFADAYQKLGELYLIVKEHEKSMKTFRTLQEIDNTNAVPYFFQAMNQKELKDTVSAIRNLQKAVELDNDYYDAYVQLGTLLAAQKNKLAIDYYNNALRLQELSIEALYGRAYMYQEIGKFEEAMKDYKKIVNLDRGYTRAYYNTGFIQLKEGQTKDAVVSFGQAIDLEPEYAEAWYNRGLAFETLKKYAEALSDYKKSLELKPGFELAQAGIKRLEKNNIK